MQVSSTRIQSWLAGLWAGSVLALGGVAAPALFAVLNTQAAGQGAGRIFAIEAQLSLFFAVVLFLIERRRVRSAHDQGHAASAMSANLLLVFAALFLTVLGQFALQPMLEAAKAGQPTRLSFGALHGLSASMYWLKAVLLLALSWRLTSSQAAP